AVQAQAAGPARPQADASASRRTGGIRRRAAARRAARRSESRPEREGGLSWSFEWQVLREPATGGERGPHGSAGGREAAAGPAGVDARGTRAASLSPAPVVDPSRSRPPCAELLRRLASDEA